MYLHSVVNKDLVVKGFFDILIDMVKLGVADFYDVIKLAANVAG